MKSKQQKNILIIDDTEDILEALELVLSDEGYQVTTSTSEAILKNIFAGTEPVPDLVMLDVLLSGQDGRVLALTIKDNPRTAHVPVIMMSAHPNVEKTIYESGADGFLAKPFELKDLFAMLKKHLK